MDELPELPFEQVLSYLSLEEVIKSRAVSRAWYHRINSFRVKSLCFSQRPNGFIQGSRRLVSGAFAQNFISSSRFASFFDTFCRSILSNLKHLRLCNLDPNGENQAAFAGSLNSFGHLQELDIIIWFSVRRAGRLPRMKFDLNLPMLHSIHLDRVEGIVQLTLDAPRLKSVKLSDCNQLSVDLVHAETVERLLVDKFEYLPVKNLKNLRYLYRGNDPPEYLDRVSRIDPSILSYLEHLKEIHVDDLDGLDDRERISKLLRQKLLSNRTELKVYLRGLLLSGPNDPAIGSLRRKYLWRTLPCLTENSSRLADEIPLCYVLSYGLIERLAPGLETNLLRRFIDLRAVVVNLPVQDTQRFLNLLKNYENIVELNLRSDQPQDLFDRLPVHSAVQKLSIQKAPSDVRFLFRMKHLIYLHLGYSSDEETVRKFLHELPFLPFLSNSSFMCQNKWVWLRTGHPNQFKVTVEGKEANFTDLAAVMQFIIYRCSTEEMKGSGSHGAL